MTQYDYEKQAALEEEAVGAGVNRYRKALEEARAKGRETTLPPVVRLMQTVIGPMSAAITDWIERMSASSYTQRAVRKPQVDVLQQFDPDQLAFIVAKTVLNSVTRPTSLQKVAQSIMQLVEDELSYRKLKEEKPGLFHYLIKDLEGSSNYQHRRRVMQSASGRVGPGWVKFDREFSTRLGTVLYDLFEKSTGTVEHKKRFVQARKSRVEVIATPKLLDWLNSEHERTGLMLPQYLPLVVPPRDWVGPWEGGYHTAVLRPLPVVKTPNKAYLEELEGIPEMANVYRALNGLQQTRWQINRAVFDVVNQLWQEGGQLGGLPSPDPLPMPAKPIDIATNEEARKEWRKKAAAVWADEISMRNHRAMTSVQLELAEKFLDEDAIFFVWQMDWRGRFYPVGNALTPQGDDLAKGLLRFAEGKPLGEFGGYWMAVHIAGLFGVDKVSFDERVAWVHEHSDQLVDSAMDPLDGMRFWATADKPFCALAACFEWAGYQIEGEDYVSHLPGAQDGSCNGLQNLSAMMRDEVGGRVTNLIPSDAPQDVYAEVARIVERKRAADDNPMAKAWEGKIDRGLCKRPVMTRPYGSVRRGVWEQVQKHIKELRLKGKASLCPVDSTGATMEDTFVAAMYIGDVIFDSVNEAVIAADKVMGWLQDTARVVASDGLPIHWTTPVGFPVLQHYRKRKMKTLDFALGKERYAFVLQSEGVGLDKRKMAQGISPNFVHSMDAAHLQLTVLHCLDNGIENFAMIHDSFGTHFADSNKLYVLLREAFIELYSGDVLADFRDQVAAQLSPDLRKKLKPLPQYGSLDINQVRDSKYFFA